MTVADSDKIKSRDTRALRSRLAPAMIIARGQMTGLRPLLPSYVALALDELDAAWDRWSQEERHAS